MKNWLFLDIDGVLNDGCYQPGQAWIDRRRVGYLNTLLEHIDHVVLSSDWRYRVLSGQMSLAGMATLLCSHGIELAQGLWVEGKSGKLHGVTDSVGYRPVSAPELDRSHQIDRYVREHINRDDRIVILDDLHIEYSCPLFVWVDPRKGLTSGHVRIALAHLGVRP